MLTLPFFPIKRTVLFLCLAGCGAAAQAVTVTMKFGQLLSGEGAPQSPDFATLVITERGNDVDFRLNTSGLNLFTGTPFLRTIAVDLKNQSSAIGSIASFSGGVSFMDISNGGGPGGVWDMGFTLGRGQDRQTRDESTIWTWAGGAGKWAGFAAHVQGVDYGNTKSIWYTAQADNSQPTATPIPEPATYGMFAAGLLALAAAQRRRQQPQA